MNYCRNSAEEQNYTRLSLVTLSLDFEDAPACRYSEAFQENSCYFPFAPMGEYVPVKDLVSSDFDTQQAEEAAVAIQGLKF